MQATLDGDIATGLAQVVAAGSHPRCQSLAAAVLSVCIVRYPEAPSLAGTCEQAISAVSKALSEVCQDQNGRASIDADVFYMLGSLTQLARSGCAGIGAVEAIVHHTLQLWPSLVASGHLLAMSVALTIMVDTTRESAEFQRKVLQSSTIGAVRPSPRPSLTASTLLETLLVFRGWCVQHCASLIP